MSSSDDTSSSNQVVAMCMSSRKTGILNTLSSHCSLQCSGPRMEDKGLRNDKNRKIHKPAQVRAHGVQKKKKDCINQRRAAQGAAKKEIGQNSSWVGSEFPGMPDTRPDAAPKASTDRIAIGGFPKKSEGQARIFCSHLNILRNF